MGNCEKSSTESGVINYEVNGTKKTIFFYSKDCDPKNFPRIGDKVSNSKFVSMCTLQRVFINSCSGSCVYCNFLLVYRNLMTEWCCGYDNSDIICRIKNDEVKMFIVIIFFQFLILKVADETKAISIKHCLCLNTVDCCVFNIILYITYISCFICQVISHISWKTFCVFLTHCLHEHCLSSVLKTMGSCSFLVHL